jgi:hypothetical protein
MEFIDGSAFGLSVYCRRRGEDEASNTVLQHGFQQGERSDGVVAKVALRLLHGFARFDERRKVQDSLHGVGAEKVVQGGAGQHVADHQGGAGENGRPPSFAEIVEGNYGMPGLQELGRYYAADVSRAAGND